MEWLGDVPEHWETLSLKHIASVQFSNVDKHTVEGEVPVRLCNYTDVYYNDSITEDLQFMEATATKHEISRFKLERGDVLITKDSEDRSDIAVPALVVDDFADVLCGYHLAQIRSYPDHCTGPYLARAFASSGIMDQFRVAASGVTRYGLPKNALRKAIFPVPPLEEQQAIGHFLDRETQKIDDLIEAKRGLLDLLKEKRQAVITHAVTRGLDPAAKLKPSGVEWLGDVPEHWELKPFKHLTRFLNGMAFKPDQWSDEGCPIIRIENLNGGTSFNCFNGEVPHRYHVRQGDLLFGWSGNRGTSFGPFLWWREGLHYLNQHIFKLHAYKCDKNWFYWTLRSLTKYMEEEAHGIIGMVHITKGKLGAVKIPAPPPGEQRAIARFLDEETEKIEDLESVVREAIASLELLRASIISAAVTGKIDVRGERA